MTAKSISREEIAALPLARYEGEVSLVATMDALQAALADVAAERVVGFDTETRPSFTKGEAYPPALVQIATARRVYLFQLRHRLVHDAIADILGLAHVVKAGVAVARDVAELKAVVPFEPVNVVDLGVVARHRGMAQTGLRNLAAIVLGVRIPKGAKTTNWAAAQLAPAQIAYAATDAWASREVYLRFESLGLLHHPAPATGDTRPGMP